MFRVQRFAFGSGFQLGVSKPTPRLQDAEAASFERTPRTTGTILKSV